MGARTSVEGIQSRINSWLANTSRAERERVINDLQRMYPWYDHHGSGRPVPFLTLPHLVAQDDLADIQEATNNLLSVLVKLEEVASANQGGRLWSRLYEASGPEGQSHLDQPYYEHPHSVRQRFRRADGLVDAQTGIIQFLEVNQVGPQAMTYYDSVHRLSADLLEVMGIMVDRPLSVCDGILDWLIMEYQQHNNTAELPRCIGVPVEHTYPSIMATIPVAVRRMQRTADQRYGKGAIEIVICHQANFEIENDTMYIVSFDGRQRCDVVWRNAARLDRHPGFCKPSIEGWRRMVRHPEALVVNGEVGPRLTRTKGALAALWDDNLVDEIGLTPEEQELVRLHVPETYYLQHTDLDQLTTIVSTKDDWVLKPSDGGLGEGIKFGANMTGRELTGFMNSPAADNYVAQCYVATRPVHLQHLNPGDGRIIELSINADLCPIIVAGEVSNQLLSRGNIIGSDTGERQAHNISQGGVVLPVFAV